MPRVHEKDSTNSSLHKTSSAPQIAINSRTFAALFSARQVGAHHHGGDPEWYARRRIHFDFKKEKSCKKIKAIGE
jgi:hypothetical protein